METVSHVEPETAWTRLEQSAFWSALTPSRRVWVTVFLANGGDSFEATRVAYRCKSDKNNRCLTYELRKQSDIVAALDFYNGKSDRELLIELARKHLRQAEPGSIAASKFTAQLERLVLGAEPLETSEDSQPTAEASRQRPVSKIGDTILVDGVPHIVTAVDANGHATDAEPR